jgi:2-methylcitrate dehydratase PrpD
LTPGIVEINTRNKVYQTRVDYPYGHPRNPANRDDLIKKFIDCASYSVKPIKKENISAAVDMISKLDELEDTRRIAELLG